jgi:hypothetical protein
MWKFLDEGTNFEFPARDKTEESVRSRFLDFFSKFAKKEKDEIRQKFKGGSLLDFNLIIL